MQFDYEILKTNNTISYEELKLKSVKNYLRIEHKDDDKIIQSMILSYVEIAEGYSGLFIKERSIMLKLCNKTIENLLRDNISDFIDIKSNYFLLVEIKKVTAKKQNLTENLTNNEVLISKSRNFKIKKNILLNVKSFKIEFMSYVKKENAYSLIQIILEHIFYIYNKDEANSAKLQEIYKSYKRFREFKL